MYLSIINWSSQIHAVCDLGVYVQFDFVFLNRVKK